MPRVIDLTRTHEWIESRIRAFGGMSSGEVSQAMDVVRSNPGSMKSLMKDLVELERMNLSEGDRGAAVRYLLQSVGQSPSIPASRWMGQRNGNSEKTPLEITVPVGVR